MTEATLTMADLEASSLGQQILREKAAQRATAEAAEAAERAERLEEVTAALDDFVPDYIERRERLLTGLLELAKECERLQTIRRKLVMLQRTARASGGEASIPEALDVASARLDNYELRSTLQALSTLNYISL